MNAAEKKTFSLLMLRPDKQFYEGEVRSLTAAEPDGQISLLPGHMPMFINITTGMASLTEAEMPLLPLVANRAIRFPASFEAWVCRNVCIGVAMLPYQIG